MCTHDVLKYGLEKWTWAWRIGVYEDLDMYRKERTRLSNFCFYSYNIWGHLVVGNKKRGNGMKDLLSLSVCLLKKTYSLYALSLNRIIPNQCRVFILLF